MTPNIAPTTAGTLWVVRIHTSANVTISSVSGGGATWNLCPASSCHIFSSALNDNQDLAYAFNGSTGTTNLTVTLSGASGSFFGGNFIEILPPAGSTASFDTAATNTVSTGTTLTAPNLNTLAGTDAVLQILSGNGAAAWNSWSTPYITDFTGNGIGLNVNSGAGPTVTVTPSGGSITAIAFKSSLGTFTPPSSPISIVNYSNPTGLNCAPACPAITIPATGAGHLLFLTAGNLSSSVSISSVSGGGSWVIPTGANSCRIGMSGGALSCAYLLSATANTTSLNVTLTGTANTSFAIMEVAVSTGQFAFDTQASATNTAQFFPTGVSLTLNGSNPDVVFQSAFIPGGASNASFYPQPLNGFNFVFTDATFGALTNVTSATAPVPVYDDLQNNATVVTGVAFQVITQINAADCTQASVQAALNQVGGDGVTVNVPACALTNWTGAGPAVSYNQVFSTILKGQGSVSTSDGTNNPLTYNDQTQICDLVSSNSNETLRITTAASKSFRMTGFSFIGGCGQNTARNIGVINVRGSGHSTRIDHNHIQGVTGPRSLNIASGDVFGVIDHNLFDEASAVTVNHIEVSGANFAASGDSTGDNSWTAATNWGTGNILVAENNGFVCTISTGCRSFDAQQGGRFVFRNNTNKNSSLQSHAVGHDGPTFRDRGPRSIEVYRNNFSWPNGGAPFAFLMDYEGGTSLWWNNTVTSGAVSQFINLDYRRATGFTYSQLAPPNGWGYCGSLQTGPNGPGPSTWDENTDTTGAKCLDGTGMGKGDLLTGATWPNVNNNVTGTQVWLRQARDPMYVWLNTLPGISNSVVTGQSDTSAINNKDYFVDAASFNGTAGVGNGTLAPSTVGAYTNAPACTNGVGYWRSTTNTLYQCQGSWGAMDVWLPFSHGTPGVTVTTATLNSDAKGPAVSWALNPATPTGLTFAVTQGDMGGSITVGATTYPYGTATQSVSLSDGNNFTYATGTVSSNQKQVVGNGYFTPGYANAGASGQNIDLVLLNDTNSSAAVIMQMNNGQPCYCVRIETNGTGGVQRSANITLVPGHRYSFSLFLDEIGAVAQLAIFDPSSAFTQVGSTVSVAQNSGFNFTSLRFGNAETGTSTGSTFFEDLMLDWTNHVFPNVPTTTWQVYYTPFTYPHPLIGSTLVPPTNLRVIPSVQPMLLF